MRYSKAVQEFDFVTVVLFLLQWTE